MSPVLYRIYFRLVVEEFDDNPFPGPSSIHLIHDQAESGPSHSIARLCLLCKQWFSQTCDKRTNLATFIVASSEARHMPLVQRARTAAKSSVPKTLSNGSQK